MISKCLILLFVTRVMRLRRVVCLWQVVCALRKLPLRSSHHPRLSVLHLAQGATSPPAGTLPRSRATPPILPNRYLWHKRHDTRFGSELTHLHHKTLLWSCSVKHLQHFLDRINLLWIGNQVIFTQLRQFNCFLSYICYCLLILFSCSYMKN